MRSLSTFKSKFKNPARTNLFYVRFTNIGTKGALGPNDLEFFCKSVTVPGINLKTMDYSASNHGLTQMIPYGMNSEPLNCTFFLDSDHSVQEYFNMWMNEIVKYDDRVKNTIGKYELGFVDEYSCTMQVVHLSSDSTYENGDRYITTLTDVFPTNISSISLSWEDTDTVATLPIQFSYSSIHRDKVLTNSGANAFYEIIKDTNSFYFEPNGRTTHTNNPLTSGNIQEFIDIATKKNNSKLSDGIKLVSKIL